MEDSTSTLMDLVVRIGMWALRRQLDGVFV